MAAQKPFQYHRKGRPAYLLGDREQTSATKPTYVPLLLGALLSIYHQTVGKPSSHRSFSLHSPPILPAFKETDPSCLTRTTCTGCDALGHLLFRYNETFKFDVSNPSSFLLVECWDEDVDSNDYIGSINLPLRGLSDGNRVRRARHCTHFVRWRAQSVVTRFQRHWKRSRRFSTSC